MSVLVIWICIDLPAEETREALASSLGAIRQEILEDFVVVAVLLNDLDKSSLLFFSPERLCFNR